MRNVEHCSTVHVMDDSCIDIRKRKYMIQYNGTWAGFNISLLIVFQCGYLYKFALTVCDIGKSIRNRLRAA